jgi:hypothetical protein
VQNFRWWWWWWFLGYNFAAANVSNNSKNTLFSGGFWVQNAKNMLFKCQNLF